MHNETSRKVLVEDLSSFEDFFDHEWTKEVFKLVENSCIEEPVFDLVASWKGNARAFVIPWLLIDGISGVISGYISAPFQLSPQRVWGEYVKHDEFKMALWKLSENVYCSMYFAYENLIVKILQEITGEPIRATQQDFKRKLREVFGESFTHKIWHQTFVRASRETRHSIVHNGSRATDDLLKIKPLPRYVQSGQVVISASVTRELFDGLKPLVYKIIQKSLEKIEAKVS